MSKRGLGARQQRFAEEYAGCNNATQAARAAGYSPKTAAATAYKLLTNVGIQEIVKQLRAQLQERTNITSDRVVEKLWAEGTFYGDGASHAARVSALSKLGEHLGMFPSRRELSSQGGGPMAVGILELAALADRYLEQRASEDGT